MLTRTDQSRVPRGFTLVELLVAMVLMGIVTAGLLSAITAQQRFYTGAAEIMETRSQIRQAIDVLPAELRGVSPTAGDIYAGYMGDASIDFRSTFGTSMVCKSLSTTQIRIPAPVTLAAGNTLSAWSETPVAGDYMALYNDSTTTASVDDGWVLRSITTIATKKDPCSGTSFTTGTDSLLYGYTVTVSTALPSQIAAGAPVRFYRRVRYALYQASDTRWYLGYCRASSAGTPCTTLQPVSGPYRPYSATAGQSGLNFYYYDVNGAITAVPTAVARIDVVVRGESEHPIRYFAGSGSTMFRDTTRIIVGLRNRT